jgi:hypothetical protein
MVRNSHLIDKKFVEIRYIVRNRDCARRSVRECL